MCNEAQAVCTGTPLKILSDQYDLNGGFSPNKEPSRSFSIQELKSSHKKKILSLLTRRKKKYLIRGGRLFFSDQRRQTSLPAIDWPSTSVLTHLF